jgi:type VII secretion-associated serine protease mycosin
VRAAGPATKDTTWLVRPETTNVWTTGHDRRFTGAPPRERFAWMRRLTSLILVLVLAANVALWVSPSPSRTVAALVQTDRGPVLTRYEDLSDAQAQALTEQLRSDPNVLGAGTVNRRRTLEDLTDRQWALARLEHTRVATLSDGSGVVVAVVDTGVDATHPDLAGRVLPGRDLVDPARDGRYDPNGHGTHVAGIIAAATDGSGVTGLASGVRILPVRVLDTTGYGDDDRVAAGILWAADQGAQVINLSLGGPDPDPVLKAAVEHVTTRGVIVVAAAGNDGMRGNPYSYPAAHEQTIAVAATQPGDTRAAFSTSAPYVDIAAPGQSVLSTFPGGRFATLSGTSMAAPYVAAAAALLVSYRKMNRAEVTARLTGSATDLGAAGLDPNFGAGIVDPYAALTDGVARPAPQPQVPTNPSLPAPTLPRLPDLPIPTLPPNPGLVTPERPPVPTLPDRPTPELPPVTVPAPGLPVTPPAAPPPVSSPVLAGLVTGLRALKMTSATTGGTVSGRLVPADGSRPGRQVLLVSYSTRSSNRLVPVRTDRNGRFSVRTTPGVVRGTVAFTGGQGLRPVSATWSPGTGWQKVASGAPSSR